MLTVRGWWFLIIVAFQLILGVLLLPYYTVTPAVLALALLAWFGYEWAAFHIRANAAVSRLRVTRRVAQGGREVPMVWAGLPFEVRVSVRHDGFARIPFAVLDDRLPVAADTIDGSNTVIAEIPVGEPARIRYTLKAPSPGVLRFEGVGVRIADLFGFFYTRRVLRDTTEYLILPPLADDEGHQRATKRFNTLPPPGVHRLRRPGSGSELLDLRDYRPGDPPKMIAWKASARRDRLITKEFESDVPVRCVLFLDTSQGMRLGPPGNTPLTRMVMVASAVAQAAAANRDLVGLTTFDEESASGSSPARTKIHMINVLRRLAEVSALQPRPTGVKPEDLTSRAYPLAHELYPELMNKKTNSMPVSRLWLPLLDRWWGWIFFFIIILSPLLVFWPWWLGMVIERSVANAPRSWNILGRLFAAFAIFVVLIMLPAVFSAGVWGIYGIRGLFGERRRSLTQRKQLCALFAVQDRSGPAGIERLVHDNEVYTSRVDRFLQEHQVRMPVPLYDEKGRYQFRCEAKAPVLATAMIRAVSGARDNELFVILADLAELGPHLAPLVKAARAARARHHHVLVIVPWPIDLPSPDAHVATKPIIEVETEPNEQPTPKQRRSKAKPKRKPTRRTSTWLPLVQASLTQQYHEAFRKLRRSLSEVGATVVRVNEGDPVQLVLERLDRLRGMRSRR